MTAAELFRALREFDLRDLDLETIGSWPVAAKAAAWALALAATLALGHFHHLRPLLAELRREAAAEGELRHAFRRNISQAATLDAYKARMAEMEAAFGALVSQLPSDTEVPGLLDDLTNMGRRNGLQFDSIALKPELTREFYVELPIEISARGSYHDLGAFVSAMAGLPRIVTLHSFHISRDPAAGGPLTLAISASTYRYKEGER